MNQIVQSPLGNATGKQNVQLMQSSSSQYKQQQTDQSLVQLGSDYSSNLKDQGQYNQNSSSIARQQQGLQQQIQNTHIDSQSYLHKGQQLNQIIKQICTPSSNSRVDTKIRQDDILNLNIPQLIFVSAGKGGLQQQQQQQQQQLRKNKKNQHSQIKFSNMENINSTVNDSLCRNQKQQPVIRQFDENAKRSSQARAQTQQSQEIKRKSVVRNSSPQNGSYISPSLQISTSISKRHSVNDLNKSRSKQLTNPNEYSSNHHNHYNCMMPQNNNNNNSNSNNNNKNTELTNFDSKQYQNSSKNNDYNNNSSSAGSSSPRQSIPADPSTKNSFTSKSQERRQTGSASGSHSLYSHGNQKIPPKQQAFPFNQQTPSSSYFSSMNSNQQLNNNEQNIQDRSSAILNSRIEALMKDLTNKQQQLSELEEMTGKRIHELEKQNSILKDKTGYVEKENNKLCRIITEQEEIIVRMKNLYPQSEESQYNNNNNNNTNNNNNNNNNNKNNDNNQDKQNQENKEQLLNSIQQIDDFEQNQIKLKNQELSIRNQVLQENIRELEFKNKELQSDVNNFIMQKLQLEQEILKCHQNFMGQQNIIHDLTTQLQQIHNSNVIQDEERIKHSKYNLKSSQSEQQNLLQSSEIAQVCNSEQNHIESLNHNIANIAHSGENGNRKQGQENQYLLDKIEDLECQLYKVYKSLNNSPSKSFINQQAEQNELKPQLDDKIFFMTDNSQQGIIDQTQFQFANGTFFSYEMVKQQQIDIENYKNALTDCQHQLVLWQERYNNLDIIHQELLKDRTKVVMESGKLNSDETNKENLKEHIMNLSRQIEDMNMLLQGQNSEIVFLKMNISQRNGEVQELQLKLESKETITQMVKKRLQDLEEQNVQVVSQKGQLKVQVKQLQDLFETQKTELQNIYTLLRTRNFDSDNIQKQLDDIQDESRRQQITIQTYEKEMDEIVKKNCNLQNQIYDLIHQQTAVNSANNMLNIQNEINQNLLNSINKTQLAGSREKTNSYYDSASNTIGLKTTPLNSQHFKLDTFPSKVRISYENPTFGNLNNMKNYSSESQGSKELSQNQLNQHSFQNNNNNNNNNNNTINNNYKYENIKFTPINNNE